MPAPLVAAGWLLAAGVSGAIAGTMYGKNPSAERDEFVSHVDNWVEFFDRLGALPVEAGARVLIGSAADLCFGKPVAITEVNSADVRDFLSLLRQYGLDESQLRTIVKSLGFSPDSARFRLGTPS